MITLAIFLKYSLFKDLSVLSYNVKRRQAPPFLPPKKTVYGIFCYFSNICVLFCIGRQTQKTEKM